MAGLLLAGCWESHARLGGVPKSTDRPADGALERIRLPSKGGSMLYCPNCDNEYEEEISACPDCGRPLEAVAPDEAENPDIALVPVYEAPNAYTAELVKGILEGEGIEVMLDGERTAVFDGVLSIESGIWGQVLVKDEDAERSLQIIAAYEDRSAASGGADDTA